MKVNIQDLFDGWEEEYLPLDGEADLSAIRAKTMRKIRQSGNRKHPLRLALIAAAAVLLLAGVTAAVYYGMNIEEVEPEAVKAADDSEIVGDEDLYFLGANHELTFDITGSGNIVGFRAAYLPFENGSIHTGVLHILIEQNREELEQRGIDIGSMELPDLENVYTSFENTAEADGEEHFYIIRTYYSNVLHDAVFTLNGEITIVKRENIGSFEAVFFTQDRSKTVTAVKDGKEIYGYANEPVINMVLLFDKEHECLLHICADAGTDMEELEKIAAGIEIVETEIPAAYIPSWQSPTPTIDLVPAFG